MTVNPACGQINKYLFEKTWVEVGSREEGEEEWFRYSQGDVYSFKGGVGERFMLGIDSTVTFEYKLKNDLILIADTATFGEIRHLSSDSMTVLIEGKRIVLFLPVLDYETRTSGSELTSLLTDRAWYFINGDWKKRYDFLDKGKYYEETRANTVVTQIIVGSKSLKEREYWAVSEYKGKFFLCVTYYSHDVFVYQIKNVSESTIETEFYSYKGYYPFTFEAIEPLQEARLNDLKKILTSQKWKMANLDYDPSFHDFEKEAESKGKSFDVFGWGGGGSTSYADSLILKDDFLGKRLYYQFLDDGTYKISTKSRTVKKGDWSLTKDGQFIQLDYEGNPGNYLEIKKARSKELVIQQRVELQLKRGENDFVFFDATIKFH